MKFLYQSERWENFIIFLSRFSIDLCLFKNCRLKRWPVSRKNPKADKKVKKKFFWIKSVFSFLCLTNQIFFPMNFRLAAVYTKMLCGHFGHFMYNICWEERLHITRIGSNIFASCLKLTLMRPIGLPPHAPFAQKSADQRWLITKSAKNRYFSI